LGIIRKILKKEIVARHLLPYAVKKGLIPRIFAVFIYFFRLSSSPISPSTPNIITTAHNTNLYKSRDMLSN
jgi:hypothetical protein